MSTQLLLADNVELVTTLATFNKYFIKKPTVAPGNRILLQFDKQFFTSREDAVRKFCA